MNKETRRQFISYVRAISVEHEDNQECHFYFKACIVHIKALANAGVINQKGIDRMMMVSVNAYQKHMAKRMAEIAKELENEPSEDDVKKLNELNAKKAEYWDWFTSQDWCLSAVAAWGGLDAFYDMEHVEDLEKYIENLNSK